MARAVHRLPAPMATPGITPGRAYRAYRYPHVKGRMSRRVNVGRRVGPFAGALSGLFIAGAAFLGTAVAATAGHFAGDLPARPHLATVPILISTFISARTGEHLLYTLEDERRELVELGQVPDKTQQATISIEDKTFWSNPGIDVGGIVRAMQANSAAGTIRQGGSTITQQLIKTRLLGDEPTVTRKIKEAILAVEATRTFSKKEILELYFDQIYYGNQSYGIKAAAKTYFGISDLNRLSLGQMAVLAGLPQAPSEYDPIQNMAAAKARRQIVLDAMVENGYVTPAEAEAAATEPIKVNPASTSLYAPHFTFRAREQLINLLGEKAAYRGGYRVYTSLDWNMQQLAEKEGRDHVNGGKPYHPMDATKEQHGPLTMRQALRESLNLPALQVTRTVGVDAIIDTVHQLGINRDWDRSRLGLSFGIGAGEMRLIDMASAYQVIANLGVRVEPTYILKIVDPSGKVVKDYSKPEGRRVLDQRYAWIMDDILKDNTNPQGSFVFGPWTSIGRPAALKTGTTDNLQDVLAIGFTPQRLTAIWMGNSDNSEMRGISSALGPGVLWRDYMKTVVGLLPPDWYARPEGIVDKVVCVNPTLLGGNGSGLLPGPSCPAGFRFTEHFVQGTEPTSDDRTFYTSCGINLRAPFFDWQRDYNAWAQGAVSGAYSYNGRFSWRICGFAPKPSESPSPSPGQSGQPVTPQPQPTPPPARTRKP